MMHGPRDGDSVNTAQSMQWKIKLFTNDELIPRISDFVDEITVLLQLGIRSPVAQFRNINFRLFDTSTWG